MSNSLPMMCTLKNGDGIRTIFLPFQPLDSVTTRQHLIDAIAHQQGIIVFQTLPLPFKHIVWVFLSWLHVMILSITSPFLHHLHLVFRRIIPFLRIMLRPSNTCYTHDQLLSLITSIPGADTYTWEIHAQHDPHMGMYLYYYQGFPKPLLTISQPIISQSKPIQQLQHNDHPTISQSKPIMQLQHTVQPIVSQPVVMQVPEIVPITDHSTPVILVTPPIIPRVPSGDSKGSLTPTDKMTTPPRRGLTRTGAPQPCRSSLSHRKLSESKLGTPRISFHDSIPRIPDMDISNRVTAAITTSINISASLPTSPKYRRRTLHASHTTPSTPAVNHSTRLQSPPRRPSYPPYTSGYASTNTSSPSTCLSVASLSPALSVCASPAMSPSPSLSTFSRDLFNPNVKPSRTPLMRRSISLPPPPEPKPFSTTSSSSSPSPIVPIRQCQVLSSPPPPLPPHQRRLEILQFQQFSQMLHSQWMLSAASTKSVVPKSRLCTSCTVQP